MTTPEVLKPACVVLTPGIKATKHVVFGSQKLGPVPTAVLDALTTTRAKLLCECKDFAKPAQYQWEKEKAQFQLDAYMENASQYLSLLQGFLNAARAPALAPTDDNDEAAASKPVVAEKPAPAVSFAFCEWLDVTAKSSVHALNAYHEYAHALYAVGTVLLQRASDLTTAMLSSRDFEFDEPKLKEAYQILLRTAGLFDAALGFLGQNRQTTAATGADDAAMAAWRAEQAQADTAATFAPELSRIKDFEGGAGLTALRAIALAQAQELVVLRGVTRETVDWVLMGKLCVDIASRYKDTLASLPASQVKLRGWCDFKTIYYTALGLYYQGVAEWNKKDAPGCVQAIAQFQQAKEQLARLTTLAAETQRTRDIIQRDLDIAAARNSSVYFETIPPPLPALPPTGLVQPQAFANPPAHALWKEPLPSAQATSAATPARGSPDLPHPDAGCACAIM
ncbi:hypothetical protein, variant [Saprolegnia diclina VS20]|uniref:BRO1 domain-containing protein n=1 Tax=Saprolegnia diclina (strain VS20) TaxID=1156394 RepID=T0Q6D1_SAPDV|nr:hypothetical protein, variant [Saprolegnia diclina VS20]EQC33404.1 hypothetical protein, variant [Saprolegnia diclina VS20]|eukprot:XP_008613044.1 hypothetical protein, variant [Saprolegnia diclina VS20]